jgi:DNA-binding CsgD family transcriptional regulator
MAETAGVLRIEAAAPEVTLATAVVPPAAVPLPRRAGERRRELAAALRMLRGAVTSEQLYELLPAALCRCGFTRAWLSLCDGSRWRPASCYTDAARLPNPLRGLSRPGVCELVHGSHEGEMVRRRRVLLVRRANGDQLVDPMIARAFRPRAYVAAPLIADTRVLGFMHADRPGSLPAVDEDDLTAIEVFAEAASQAMQRVVLAERIECLRRELQAMTHSIGEMVEQRCCEPLSLPWPAASRPDGVAPAAPERGGGISPPSAVGSRLGSLLSARELEVLRLMASGETNAGIASQLVITEGTVKSHVKSVLRKLHAANRAQAVSRYYRLVRG